VPVLKKATIKSYDASGHKAAVQISGSLAVWLESVPVATDIPAAEVQAGRECTVLFFTDDNPDDAVVVTVHGAVPAAAGAVTSIQDADGNTYVRTEQVANEDKVRIALAATERGLFQTASPHVTLTGDVRIASGQLGVGVNPDGTATFVAQGSGALTANLSLIQAKASGINLAADNVNLFGVQGAPQASVTLGKIGLVISALDFSIAAAGGGAGTVITLLAGVVAGLLTIGFTGTITELVGVRAKNPVLATGAASQATTAIGVDVQDYGPTAKIVDAYGLRIANMTLNTGVRRLIEAGGALGTTPYLRLEGGTAPAANQTKLLLAEGVTPTLRRVQWKPGNTLVAGDNVMVLV